MLRQLQEVRGNENSHVYSDALWDVLPKERMSSLRLGEAASAREWDRRKKKTQQHLVSKCTSVKNSQS